MVDFNKRRAGKGSEKKTDPLEIYDSLDRKSETGPLRPAQAQILSDWYSQRRDDKDLIIKLHTGQGKTLIGLLILQSRLNEGRGPALYLCPNIYLVHQTFEQANKFGIRCCLVESDGQIPYDFLNGNKILITHIQKVFNGLTKFKLGSQSIQVDTVILDDSHACIDSIKDALSLKIPNASPVYNQFLALFESDLKNQGEGSFLEILNGERTTLPVPYWSWNEKQSDVLNILSHNKEEDSIKFTWPLIKDNLENCQAFISGQEIEITQYIGTIWQFGTFHNAKQRILMSATTLDDSFFIKGLSIDAQAVEKPLMYQKEKWSG
ncbi:MAG: DEAD/DEAH box helicase, partial [Chitinophagaceae bacterium]